MDSSHTTNHQESTDIFSLSDQDLSDRLHFIEEIGFGNWGSVWLCQPKSTSSSSKPSSSNDQKLAVKLVHRSKTSTTAARVRSLWNEMKIVRTFKSDPHPSIIPFHSFIITPSYALITMAFLPTLVPVEVDEPKAREWFRLLLSGVEFLHKRGVVHNDIKPANILLSHKNVPVLVDFGFAEKYDLGSSTAFHSNLSYGTPEYLSPERARGLPHDTRKSDVWSLGITFFEILMGRTPFEHSDGEQFTTKEDLEKYWTRTLRGKWVGSWNMSKGIERLLHRMIAPNADLRCTSSDAMADTYWEATDGSSSPLHRRSVSSSIIFQKELAKLEATPPRPSKNEVIASPPGLTPPRVSPSIKELTKGRPLTNEHRGITKAKSQSRVATTKVQPKKRVAVIDLSPIRASPQSSPLTSSTAKENVVSLNSVSKAKVTARRPLGAASARENLPAPPVTSKRPMMEDLKPGRRGRGVLSDLTGQTRNSENADQRVTVNGTRNAKGKAKEVERNSVRDRVKEWEREKQRLREMERLEELERERDEEIEKEKETKERHHNAVEARERAKKEEEKENHALSVKPNHLAPSQHWSTVPTPIIPLPTTARVMPLSTPGITVLPDTPSRPSTNVNGPTKNGFKHSIKKSIDKTMQFYKLSINGRGTHGRTFSADLLDEADLKRTTPTPSRRESWEEEALSQAGSPLPVVRNAVDSERVAADNRVDRMTIWMRNVEKVVSDARENFASSSNHAAPLPPLPLAPLSRSVSANRNLNASTNRSSRLPRKPLAANEIFSDDGSPDVSSCQLNESTMNSTAYATAGNASTMLNNSTSDSRPTEGTSQLLVPEIWTPARPRRATVSGLSPEHLSVAEPSFDLLDGGSPSKRKEKSRSHGNLFQLHITPISMLEAELAKPQPPTPNPRLSAMLDRSLFITSPLTPRTESDVERFPFTPNKTPLDELAESPFHVEPYPPRKPTQADEAIPDTPNLRRLEGVYDRFLMATSGVKRLGKGYQSDNVGPVGNNASNFRSHTSGPQTKQREGVGARAGAGAGGGGGARSTGRGVFHTGKKVVMPPPVSSEDLKKFEVDEMGIMTRRGGGALSPSSSASSGLKDESNNATVALVRRAIKAFVPGKTTTRRASRMVV